mgnify:CR=1 FL=1
MDATDRRILALLVEDARRTYDDVGRQVGLSAPAVKRRVDRLRATGALRGFTAVVDQAALGWTTEALIELFFQPGTLRDQIATTLRRHPEVVEARALVDQFSETVNSGYGRLTRLRPVIQMSETPACWERPTVPPGTDTLAWASAP